MRNALQTALLLAAFMAVAQPESVEITSEPSHHLVLNNNFVRVFDVTVAPKATTLIHRHNYDYLFVTLGDSDVTSARVGAQPVQLVLKDGEVRYTPGKFAHAAINNADRPFRNITIELLGATTGEHACTVSCSVALPCKSADKSACPTAERLVTSDQWTVIAITLPPSAVLEEHTHQGSHLAVAVSDLDIKIKKRDAPESEVHAKTGDLSWQQPVTHTLTNIGSKPARFVSLEFRGTPEPGAHGNP